MSRRETAAAVADAEPTLEELLRPLRDRYRFLEDYFNLQAEAVFAECPTEMSSDGLFGLNEICREGGDLLDDLIDHLPRSVINARVPNVREPGPGPARPSPGDGTRGDRDATPTEHGRSPRESAFDDDEDDHAANGE